MCIQTESIPSVQKQSGLTSFFTPAQTKKLLYIALSTLMALGVIFCYILGAPWFLTLGFFGLTLAPLFSIGRSVDFQRQKIIK